MVSRCLLLVFCVFSRAWIRCLFWLPYDRPTIAKEHDLFHSVAWVQNCLGCITLGLWACVEVHLQQDGLVREVCESACKHVSFGISDRSVIVSTFLQLFSVKTDFHFAAWTLKQIPLYIRSANNSNGKTYLLSQTKDDSVVLSGRAWLAFSHVGPVASGFSFRLETNNRKYICVWQQSKVAGVLFQKPARRAFDALRRDNGNKPLHTMI